MGNIEFNIGDKIIDIYGKMGTITGICDCKKCLKRGFSEPIIENEEMYITDTDYAEDFRRYYKIGNNLFPQHVDISNLKNIIQNKINEIEKCKTEISKIEKFIVEVSEN